ncbi:MAG: hypothetical protein AB1540_09610 [Bdellovibrionota bacterium]
MWSQTQVRAAEAPFVLTNSNLSENQLRLGLSANYLRSTENYNQNRKKAGLTRDGSFQSLELRPFGQYGLTQSLTLLADFEIVSNAVEGRSSLNEAKVSNRSTGLGDGTLGARYDFSIHPLRFFAEGLIQFPLYTRLRSTSWTVLTPTSSVPRGNGATEFTLLGGTEVPMLQSLWLGASVGYTTRTLGYSNYFSYSAYAKYEEKKRFFGQIGLRGQATATEDSRSSTSSPERATTVISDSQAFNAVNPTFVKLEARFGSYLSQAFFGSAGIQLPLLAKNTPVEPVFIAALGFDLGGEKGPEYAHSNRGFQQYYFDSKVLQVNNDLKLILIDKGRSDAVKIGELMDVFEPNTREGNPSQTVARGRVIEAGPNRSKIKILEYFREGRIEEGFVVRRPIR